MKTNLIIFLFMLLGSSGYVLGASNLKFNKKAAEKVWNIRNDMFDAAADIPDSLRQGASAVFIADYYNVSADREYYSTPQSTTNRTRRVRWNRRMVKLFDTKAIEDFSEHEFGNRVRLAVDWFTFGGSDNAFGARIHKPDGRVEEVDIEESIAVLEGKKGKEKDAISRKIAIPGLEPGDVLEYFTYTEEWLDDLDLPDVQIIPFDDYPVARLVVEGEFSPELTVEYRTYNGFHDLQGGSNNKGRNFIAIDLTDISTLTDKQYINSNRQLPFLRLSTLNNTSAYRYYPRSLRRGGLYGNLPAGTIYRDIKNALKQVTYDDVLVKKVKKIVGDYRKLHPETVGNDLIDVYWLAGEYVNATDEKCGFSDYGLAVMMSDLVNKAGISDKDATVGFLNSRRSVPTKEIMSWRQPDFGMLLGDTLYMETGQNFCVPGELPGLYQGEEGGTFSGDRKMFSDNQPPKIFEMPTSKSHENKLDVVSAVTLDVDDNKAFVKFNVTSTGASKYMAAPLTDHWEWVSAVEDFLGIPDKQRYQDKTYDAEARKTSFQESADALVKSFINPDAEDVTLAIEQRGIVPGAPEVKLSGTAVVEDCLSDAGDELLFNIGKFVGNNVRIDGSQRERQLDVCFSSPHQLSYDLTFDIPSGFAVDQQSLDNLQISVNNKYGLYHATASLNDNDQLELHIRERYKTYVVPVDHWSDILEIFDASAMYNDAVVVLKKK